MINRMIESSDGEITINGKNIKDINAVELRRNIGWCDSTNWSNASYDS